MGAAVRAGLLLLLAIVALAGCGGAGTESTPLGADTGGTVATGVSDPDVQAFRLNLWLNLQQQGRCAGCHSRSTQGQSPLFADSDVSTAYGAAVTLVNRSNPAASRLVTKVATGHGCWSTDANSCADQMTSWIDRWVNGGGSGGVTEIELTPPPIQPVGNTVSFLDDGGAAFRFYLHQPILEQYCSNCHSGDARVPQSPFFAGPADGNGGYQTAYDEAKPKIDLATPANSRFVLRMLEQHNCWTDCATAAQEMQTAIEAFASNGGRVDTTVDPGLEVSQMLLLGNGTVVSGGARVEAGVIAKYDFSTGTGDTVYDRSPVSPALNLTLSPSAEWVGGFGVRFSDANAKAQGLTTDSAKLRNEISQTGEYSIEAWVIPANVTQEDANIVSYSGGAAERNFALGQTLYNYDFLNRTTVSDANGNPALSTADADERLQATLQHVVVTFDPLDGRKIYVNGEYTQDLDADAGAEVIGWDNGYALVLGNEVSGDRPWLGTLRLVAIFNRALSPTEIQQNFDAGVGEKFYLLFNIGDQIDPQGGTGGPAQHYIMLEVSEFDQFGYLFQAPTFVSLDPNYVPNFALQGMRIGINGKEAAVGQVYTSLDVQVSQRGQVLSPLGAVIAKEQGPDFDEFFLSFDVIGANQSVVVRPVATRQPPAVDLTPTSAIGIRTFDEINITMAEITGVDPENAEIETTYQTIKQQLPTVEDIEGFLSSHQVAIAQLAIEYCDKLVENGTLRTQFFGNFGFDQTVANAFPNDTAKHQIIDALYDRIFAIPNQTSSLELDNVPTRAEVRLELSNSAIILDTDEDGTPDQPGGLFDRLTLACPTGCDAARTRTVVKAMCAATLGSANMLIQ